MRKLFIVCIILLAMSSCESVSSGVDKVRSVPLEKVVILDSTLGSVSDSYVRYKIKRINKGVVTFVSIPKGDGGRYEKGDTIFYKFN